MALPHHDQYLHQLLSQAKRRPAESSADELSDFQLYTTSGHDSTGLESAEVEALKLMPDSTISEAMNDLPEDYRMVVYYADVVGLAYKRSPKSWIRPSER